MESRVTFFEKDGKLHFTIKNNPELEADVRMSIKKQYVNPKQAFYFMRGILDAVNAILTGKQREYGTPMVEIKNPFNGESQVVTCQEAKSILEDIGGNYEIRQISGSKLSDQYFESNMSHKYVQMVGRGKRPNQEWSV